MIVLPFILNLIIPLVMLIVGYQIKKKPNYDMKSQNGYSTPIARRSQESWDFGQKIAPIIFISNGQTLVLIELVLTYAMTMMKLNPETCIIIGNAVGALFLFLAFHMTDTEIENNVQM